MQVRNRVLLQGFRFWFIPYARSFRNGWVQLTLVFQNNHGTSDCPSHPWSNIRRQRLFFFIKDLLFGEDESYKVSCNRIVLNHNNVVFLDSRTWCRSYCGSSWSCFRISSSRKDVEQQMCWRMWYDSFGLDFFTSEKSINNSNSNWLSFQRVNCIFIH